MGTFKIKYRKWCELKAEITYHKYCYYELNSPDISDQEYDGLENRFNEFSKRLGMVGSWVEVKREDKPICD